MAVTKEVWSDAECRRFFVHSTENITYQELAELSGYSLSTISRKSNSDPLGSWVKQRENYRKKLDLATSEKAIDKLSDLLSDRFSAIQFDCYEKYKTYADLAFRYAELKMIALDKAREEGSEEEKRIMAQTEAKEVNYYNTILERSLKGIREVTGLIYFVNQNMALEETRRLGYVPVVLPPGMTAEDLQKMLDDYVNKEENE